MNLLFINDGSFYSGLVTELLGFKGYAVFEAVHFAEASNILRQKRVDVVLIYIPLAATQHLTLLSEIRTHDPALPIIVLSTYSKSSQVHQQIRAVTPHYLILPFSTERLVQMITDITDIEQTKPSLPPLSLFRRQNGAADVN